MNILRLSTLTLALAIAVITLGYVNSSSAAPKKCLTDPTAPGCGGGGDGDGDTTIGCATCVYTAKLIGTVDEAFEFGTAMPVGVTPNAKENSLQIDMPPTVAPRGGFIDPVTVWYDVFTDCLALGPTAFMIPKSFQVESVIEQPGGIGVKFIGIKYGEPEVSVVVHLIGTIFDGSFLPADPSPGKTTTISHPMTISLVHGHTTSKGKKGHCNKTGRTGTVASTLTITATAPPED